MSATALRAAERGPLIHQLLESAQIELSRIAPGMGAAERSELLGRVAQLTRYDDLLAAVQSWACETMRAWAPLALLFPDARCECPSVAALNERIDQIIEREYGHVLAAAGSHRAARELLASDAARLSIEVAVASAVAASVDPALAQWASGFSAQALRVAEYLHRNALGIRQSLTDRQLMLDITAMTTTQRDLRSRLHLQLRAASGA
ncbi:MAG: hypothetical protein R3E77_01790 [Steroidobacteraceae bacterium]